MEHSAEVLAVWRSTAELIHHDAAVQQAARMSLSGARADEMIPVLVRGMEFITSMALSALQSGAPEILMSQLDWANVRLPVDGISGTNLLQGILSYREAVVRHVAHEHARQILPLIDTLVDRQRHILGDAHEQS